jgi:hypothetical protein
MIERENIEKTTWVNKKLVNLKPSKGDTSK